GRAQHRLDEVPIAIDRPIQIAPTALDLEVGFINIPTLARALTSAVPSLAQRLTHYRQQLGLPLPDAFVADSETTQQHDLAEIPQGQPVTQPAEHHEGDYVAWQRRTVEDTVTLLVGLLPAVPPPAPTIPFSPQLPPPT